MTPIKLIAIETLSDETIRLQSQLPFISGNNVADFILKNGALKEYRNGDLGFCFYETDIPYILVTDPKEMTTQKL